MRRGKGAEATTAAAPSASVWAHKDREEPSRLDRKVNVARLQLSRKEGTHGRALEAVALRAPRRLASRAQHDVHAAIDSRLLPRVPSGRSPHVIVP